MTTNNYVDLEDSKFVSITGEDKSDFLQGIITNDINKCNSEKLLYSCFLSPQGKFISDFFILKDKNRYLIEIHKNYFDEFIKKLNIYKLRSKVKIDEDNLFKSIVLLDFNESEKIDRKIYSFYDPRTKILGLKIFIEKDKVNNFLNKHNLQKTKFDVYRNLLIKNLIPYSPEDLIINKSLLLENNFEKLNAIDWNKGCYVGQEITARMKYRSLLKKSIRSLKILSGKVSIGSKVFYKKNEIGEIISYNKNFAIAMMKIEHVKEIIDNEYTLNTEESELKIFK
tara:strand:+ start:77 stop:922 length:846 start_codon:yes stop_codon:yes gene_type:complete